MASRCEFCGSPNLRYVRSTRIEGEWTMCPRVVPCDSYKCEDCRREQTVGPKVIKDRLAKGENNE